MVNISCRIPRTDGWLPVLRSFFVIPKPEAREKPTHMNCPSHCKEIFAQGEFQEFFLTSYRQSRTEEEVRIPIQASQSAQRSILGYERETYIQLSKTHLRANEKVNQSRSRTRRHTLVSPNLLSLRVLLRSDQSTLTSSFQWRSAFDEMRTLRVQRTRRSLAWGKTSPALAW